MCSSRHQTQFFEERRNANQDKAINETHKAYMPFSLAEEVLPRQSNHEIQLTNVWMTRTLVLNSRILSSGT